MFLRKRGSWERLLEAMHAIEAVLTDEPQTAPEIVSKAGLGKMEGVFALKAMLKHDLVRVTLLGSGGNVTGRREGYSRTCSLKRVAEGQGDRTDAHRF